MIAACDQALSDAHLLDAYADLQTHPQEDDEAPERARTTLREFSLANPHSSAFVDLLVAGEHTDHGWDDHWPMPERWAMIAHHLMHPGNELLAAKHVEYLWYHLLAVLGRAPVELTPGKTAEASAIVEFILKLASNHGAALAHAWDHDVWANPSEQMSQIWDWTRWRSKLERAINDQALVQPLNKSEAAGRDEYLQMLLKVIDARAGKDRMTDLLRGDLTVWREGQKPKLVDLDMQEIYPTYEANDYLDKLPNLSLLHRLSRLIQDRLPANVQLERYKMSHALLRQWARDHHRKHHGIERYVDPQLNLNAEQEAVVRAMDRDPRFKKTVFANAQLGLSDAAAQAWRTVHAPDEVRRAVEALKPKSQAHREFAANLRRELDLKPADLSGAYAFYADEIFDAIPKEKPDDGESVVRFARRSVSDLKLGEKIGDCTALGGDFYAEALTWYANAAYNVFTVHRGGRLMAKLGLALMIIDGRPAIMIDSIELHPQARTWSMPYFREGEAALRDGLHFATQLAERMGRDLYASPASNTPWISPEIKSYPLYSSTEPEADVPHSAAGQYVYDADNTRRVLGLAPAAPLQPFYQLLLANADRDPNFVTAGAVDRSSGFVISVDLHLLRRE